MEIILRIIGAIWILLSLKESYGFLRHLAYHGLNASLGVQSLLYLMLLGGGVGLVMLKEWGRWLVLIGTGGFLLLLVGPSLLHGQIGPLFLRHFIFYGIFIALLCLPQARSATGK